MDNFTNFSNSSSNSTNSTFEDWQSQQPAKSFWTNLTLPVLYLTILIGSLYTFSSLYRKRQTTKAARLASWFPRNKARDVYLSLLHLDPAEASEGDDKKLKQVPDSVLKAALLRRALEDIQRIVQLRTSKQALQTLLQRGSVGEELWLRFQRAEQEIEEEVKDVVNEANAFAQGWGQTIFQSANEINQNNLVRQRVAELQAAVEEDKAWWAKKRSGVQAELMKEVGIDDGPTVDDAVLVEGGGPAGSQGGANKQKAKQ